MSDSGDDISSGDDDDGGGNTNGGGSSTSRAGVQKLKAEARSKQVSKRRKKQVTEAFNLALSEMRQELAAGMSNATAASGAIPAVDSEFAGEKHQADIDLQKARLARVEEEKRTHAIENQQLLQSH